MRGGKGTVMNDVEKARAQAEALHSAPSTGGKQRLRQEALSRYLAAEAKHARGTEEADDSKREKQTSKGPVARKRVTPRDTERQ